MEKQKYTSKYKRRRSQKGQVLIIVVFAITTLVAFVGLVVDLGLVFIQYGRLRRSVDAAALSASLQYREGYTPEDLSNAAVEFLTLNGIDDPTAVVNVCNPDFPAYNDESLCTNPKRKLVRVIASSNVHLAFLPVIGIRSVPLKAEAISEAASVDVVIAIDRSESMTFDAPPGSADRDPSVCNSKNQAAKYTGDCSPFSDVKKAADEFVDNLYFPYDRVGVVTFDRNVHPLPNGDDSQRFLPLSDEENKVHNIIQKLWVFQAGADNPDGSDVGEAGDTCEDINGYIGYVFPSPPPPGPCRAYDWSDLGGTGTYGAFDCPLYFYQNSKDSSTCTTTNIGGGLLEAGVMFSQSFRKEALWVVILLTDGAANSSVDYLNGNAGNVYCPHHYLNCRDSSTATRHCADPDPAKKARCEKEGGVWSPSDYDADDFARDMVDYVAYDQNALIFSIGLGDLTLTPAIDPAGESLLKYAADAGDGDPNSNGADNGFYYFAPSGSQLRQIFAQIADKIAVRLTH